jgi:HEAT repeat protein
MKKQFLLLTVSLLLISFVSAFAGNPETKDYSKVGKEAVDNLLVGVKSENRGLRVSCAYFLGEYKANIAVIPLMKMLHDEKTEEGRIIAALSLVKIGNAMGIYAVKEAAEKDNSQRVRNLCARFYNTYAANETDQESKKL